MQKTKVKIKSKEEVEIMKEGGRMLSSIMEELKGLVRPGIATKELEKAAQAFILKSGGKCSFKGYREPGSESDKPFPACLCVSVNEEIVHFAPSQRILKEGDIVSLDLGLEWQGFHSDMAVTLPVGRVKPESLRLIRVAKKALKRGIKKIRPGKTVGDIGNTIQRYVESQGFNVVRDLCGHGIGKEIHEEPQILNYGKRRAGLEIKEGMVLCLEPMVVMGNWQIEKSKDGFGYRTKDGSLSAHFEQTIAVTKNNCQVLTK